jgi:AcrR family transcriptional regulator
MEGSEDGEFSGFTLNEASRTAGVSVSAPYNHFKDKEALLVEIVLLGNRTLESDLQAAAKIEAPPEDRLVAVCLAYIEFARRHPDIFAVMFQSGIDKSRYPEIHAAGVKAFQVAEDLAAQIEPTAAEAEELALAIWTTAHGFATLTADGAVVRVAGAKQQSPAEALVRRVLAVRRHLSR